jgi:hypothetical protein
MAVFVKQYLSKQMGSTGTWYWSSRYERVPSKEQKKILDQLASLQNGTKITSFRQVKFIEQLKNPTDATRKV